MPNDLDYCRNLTADLAHYRERPDICDWVEREVVLAGPSEYRPGPISLDMTPYARGILRAFTDIQTKDLTIVAATQVIKTTILRLILAYALANWDLVSGLWGWPNEKTAKNFTKGRWIPMVMATPCLARLIPEDPDAFTNLKQMFTGHGSIRFEGSGSPANLASEPANLTIIDEADKMALESEREASSILQIHQRVKAYSGNHKNVMASSPTVETGPIWQAFLEGSQERYFMPCPHCGLFFNLRREHFIFDHCKLEKGYDLKKVDKETYVKCPADACGKSIYESHKTQMLKRGEWRATNPNPKPGHRSFHLGSQISPFVSWGAYITEWILGHGTPGGLQNFFNSWEGEPWNFTSDADPGALSAAICKGHKRGTMYGEVLISVDVQQTELHWLARGYTAAGSRLINHGTVGSEKDIDDLQEKLKAKHVYVDSGHRTTEVYKWCHERRHKGWVAVKGNPTGQKVTWSQKVNPFYGNQKLAGAGARIKLLHINNEIFNDEICRARKGENDAWKVYDEVADDRVYKSELFGIVMRLKTNKKGFKELVAHRLREEHCYDLELYNMAGAYDARLIGPRSRFASSIQTPQEDEKKEAEITPEETPAVPEKTMLEKLEKVEPELPGWLRPATILAEKEPEPEKANPFIALTKAKQKPKEVPERGGYEIAGIS